MRRIEKKDILRVIDANLNRIKEGLRVCEDVSRFILDDRGATRQYKAVRHKISRLASRLCGPYGGVVQARNIGGDVGRKTIACELRRQSVKDIFYANSQRTKESVRVLEEFAKLTNAASARDFKKLRYAIYALERKISERL